MAPEELTKIIDKLSRVEQSLGFSLPESSERAFHSFGKWIVPADYLDWLANDREEKGGTEELTEIDGIIRQLHHESGGIPDYENKLIDSYKLRAPLVFVGPYRRGRQFARLFYFEPRLASVKVGLKGKRARQLLHREVEVRLIFEEIAPELITPNLYQAKLDHEPPFYAEPVINFRTFDLKRDTHLLRSQFLPAYTRLQRTWGVEVRSLSSALSGFVSGKDSEELKPPELIDILKLFKKITWQPNWIGPRQMAEQLVTIFNSDKKLLVGLIHGDVHTSNFLVDEENSVLYFIDWEDAQISYIFRDWYKMLRYFPPSVAIDLIEKNYMFLAGEFPDEDIIDWQSQLIIYFYHQLRCSVRSKKKKRPEETDMNWLESNLKKVDFIDQLLKLRED